MDEPVPLGPRSHAACSPLPLAPGIQEHFADCSSAFFSPLPVPRCQSAGQLPVPPSSADLSRTFGSDAPDGLLRKLNLHIVPHEPVLDIITSYSDLRREKLILESFYDTPAFHLLRNGCWLSCRQELGDDDEGLQEWVWQQESAPLGQSGHVCTEFLAQDREAIKPCLGQRLPAVFSPDKLWHSLDNLCSVLVARFVTLRVIPESDEARPPFWVDQCFFDAQGAATYEIVTYPMTTTMFTDAKPTAAPSKVMEYLWRFRPALYDAVHSMESKSDSEAKQLLSKQKTPPFRPESVMGGLLQCHRPTPSQLSRIDPEASNRAEALERLLKQRAKVIKENLYPLLRNPDLQDKWVVLTKGRREPLYQTDNEVDAVERATELACEQNAPCFAMQVNADVF